MSVKYIIGDIDIFISLGVHVAKPPVGDLGRIPWCVWVPQDHLQCIQRGQPGELTSLEDKKGSKAACRTGRWCAEEVGGGLCALPWWEQARWVRTRGPRLLPAWWPPFFLNICSGSFPDLPYFNSASSRSELTLYSLFPQPGYILFEALILLPPNTLAIISLRLIKSKIITRHPATVEFAFFSHLYRVSI